MKKLVQIKLPNYVEGELDNKPIFQQIDHTGAYGHHAGHAFTDMSEIDHKMHTAAYYAMVDLIDQQVGRLITTLKESGQYENTLIIFTSDHGEMLGDHGLYLKGPFFYDCAVKVPLIISHPNITKKGLRVSGLVELMDLPQTLLEAAAMPPYKGMMGKSLWDLCLGKQAPTFHKEVVYCEYYNAMGWHKDPKAQCTMVFDGRYKIVACHGIDQGELYDLQQDPNETNNLWEDSEKASLKMQMLMKLTDKMAFTCDPLSERISEW